LFNRETTIVQKHSALRANQKIYFSLWSLCTLWFKTWLLKFTKGPPGQIGFGLTPSPGKPKNKKSLCVLCALCGLRIYPSSFVASFHHPLRSRSQSSQRGYFFCPIGRRRLDKNTQPLRGKILSCTPTSLLLVVYQGPARADWFWFVGISQQTKK